MPAYQFCSVVQAISVSEGAGSPSPGERPRGTAPVTDSSGLVPLVNKVGWLRQADVKTTDPHVLVTWVKKIGGHAQAGEPHSPSGQAGRGLDATCVAGPQGVALGWENRGPSAQQLKPVRGFTLLEVLLALSLACMVLAAVTMAIRFQIRLVDTGRLQAEQAQLARAILNRIADDIRGAVPYTRHCRAGCEFVRVIE